MVDEETLRPIHELLEDVRERLLTLPLRYDF